MVEVKGPFGCFATFFFSSELQVLVLVLRLSAGPLLKNLTCIQTLSMPSK